MMSKQTLGTTIQSLRKQNNLTQLELADKLGVTDKAVSKWERDLSCPDISLMPKIAEIFSVSVDELMQAGAEGNKRKAPSKADEIISLVCKAVTLAMGVGVAVLSAMKQIDMYSALSMLGIGLAAAGISSLRADKK